MKVKDLKQLLLNCDDNAELYIYDMMWIYDDCSNLRRMEDGDIKITQLSSGTWVVFGGMI